MKIDTWTKRGLPEIDLFQRLTERCVTDVTIHNEEQLVEIILRPIDEMNNCFEYIKFKSIKHLMETMTIVNPLDEVAKRIQTIVNNSVEYDMLMDIKKYNKEFEEYLLESYIQRNIKYHSLTDLSPNELREKLIKDFYTEINADKKYFGNFFETFLS